jgi:hypothetical protein
MKSRETLENLELSVNIVDSSANPETSDFLEVMGSGIFFSLDDLRGSPIKAASCLSQVENQEWP